MDKELEDALIALEEELAITVPMGMGKMPPSIRYATIVIELKKRLCPHIHVIRTDGAHVVTSTTDALLSYVTNIPIVAATIARYLAQLRLEEFCKTPTALLDAKIADDE